MCWGIDGLLLYKSKKIVKKKKRERERERDIYIYIVTEYDFLLRRFCVLYS